MWIARRNPHHEHWRAPSGRLAATFGMILKISDPLLLLGTALAAYQLQFNDVQLSVHYWRLIAITMLLSLLVLSMSSIYSSWRGRSLLTELANVLLQWLVIFGCLFAYVAAIKAADAQTTAWVGSWLLLSLASVSLLRLLIRATAAWARARGNDLRTAVIVGATPDTQKIITTLRDNSWAGICIQGWFSTRSDRCVIDSSTALLGTLNDLGGYVESHATDQVWIALPMRDEAQITLALNQLQHSTVDIKFVPDMFGFHLLNHSIEQLAGLPVINLQQTPLQGSARVLKALEDRLLAALILLVISPLMLAIAIAVKLSSPGPVFYRQERMSWNNSTFQMLKFRSMPVDAEAASGAVWAKAGESRATKIGAFLRKTSLDELPQFLNVLIGDMSIVGPRPERPVFVHKFKHEIPSYMKKHMVKAGITGWAQVNGWRGSTDLHKRIECDLFYIENWSLGFDLRIIVATLFKGFVNKNAY